MTVGKIKEGLLQLLYPPRCVFCGGLLAKGEAEAGICPDCERSLPRTKPDRLHTLEDSLALTYSVFLYQGAVKQSIRRYKFRGRAYYHKVYGVLLRDYARERLPQPPDLVTWAPLSRLRLCRRGYDQARLLADEVAVLYGQKAVRLLRKRKHTKPQSALSARARRENVKDVYALSDDADLPGKRVLLVDDVTTTGSTLDACARLLLNAGAAEVACLTLARSRYGEDRER